MTPAEVTQRYNSLTRRIAAIWLTHIVGMIGVWIWLSTAIDAMPLWVSIIVGIFVVFVYSLIAMGVFHHRLLDEHGKLEDAYNAEAQEHDAEAKANAPEPENHFTARYNYSNVSPAHAQRVANTAKVIVDEAKRSHVQWTPESFKLFIDKMQAMGMQAEVAAEAFMQMGDAFGHAHQRPFGHTHQGRLPTELVEALNVLGIEPVFAPTREHIANAYRNMAKIWHPDTAPKGDRKQHEEQFDRVRKARDIARKYAP